jgi:hypothetical protein
MKKSEAQIQKAVIRYAADRGVPHIRLTMRQGLATGWPDVLFLIPGGKPLFIEFKAPGKTPNPVQLTKKRILLELNYAWSVCDDISYGKGCIDAAIPRGNVQ